MIKIESLRKRYDARKERPPALAIDGLRLTSGRIYGIVGPNGAGKTTLLRCLSGNLVFDGRILLDGKIATAQTLRRAAVYLDQRPEANIFPALTVLENLVVAAYRDTGLNWRRPNLARGLSLLQDSLPAESFLRVELDRPAGELSGGQTQLLGIAMSLLARKRILLLDEFFANLDPARRARVGEKVRDLVNYGRSRTALYVSHNLQDAARWSDEIIILRSSRILRQVSARDFRGFSDRDRLAIFEEDDSNESSNLRHSR